MVEVEEEHEVWRGVAHIASACRLALQALALQALGLQAQDPHGGDGGCVDGHLPLARAIDTALANLYLALHDAVALAALLNDADNLVEVEQIEPRLRAAGANDAVALLLARDGRAHQALSLWRDSGAPRRTHDSEVRRLDAVAHTVRYLERPLARLSPGQRWEMVSHFIGWVIDARPRAALAMLVAATPPAPANHTPSATAVPQLDRERGNRMAQAAHATEVAEGLQRVDDEALHTVRHDLSVVRSEGRVEEVEELDSELVGGLLERHNLVLYGSYLEALFAASLAPAHHLPHHHPTSTTPITTGKHSTVCTRLAVLYLHLLAAACTLPLPSQARGDEGPRWSGGEERCRYLHLLAHTSTYKDFVLSPRPSLAHLGVSGAAVAPTLAGSYTSSGQKSGSECAMAEGMEEVGLKMLGVLRHGGHLDAQRVLRCIEALPAEVQHAVCEHRMLLHRRLALELYPHSTQLELYAHTWHGESESKGVDDVGYESKGVDDVGYGALTAWEHHGRALEILCVVMGDVDGAVAYCHAAVPVCPKATPLRFAPVATPPRSLDSRRAVTGRLLLLLLSILLTPAPSEDDKASEYDVRDMPDEYDVPDMPEYDVPDMPDILAPCLLPRPPTPSPHHTREGAGRVGKAASKTHPHCCSMTQHGSSAHYLAHYSAKGQAARAHQHHDRQAHSGGGLQDTRHSGGALQDQQSKLHTGQPPHTSQNEDRAQVAGWVVARRKSLPAAHWSMQGGHTTSKQGTSLEECHSSEGLQQYNQDEEALQQQYNEDEEALQDYNETSEALEEYSDEDAATRHTATRHAATRHHPAPCSQLAQARFPSSLAFHPEMHNPHVLTHRVAHINSRRVVRIDRLAQPAPPHMHPCLAPHKDPSRSQGLADQAQPLNTPIPYQSQGNAMGACRSPAGRGVEGAEEVWMEADGGEGSLPPLHTADAHLDRTDGVCGTDEAWTVEVLAEAWSGMPQGHTRLVTRVRSSLHQRALHQRALRQRADGLEALWCGKDEDSHPASRTATPTLHSQRRQALTIVAQHEHLLEGVAVLEALPAHCTLHDAAPVVGYLLRRSVVQRHAVVIKANVCKMRHMQVSKHVQLLGTQRVMVTRQSVCAETGKSIGVKPFQVLPDLSLQLLED